MRPGRELDTQIAQEIFGHKVWARGKVLHENPETGDRPLRHYSKEIEWAAKVAEKMKITLIPIEGDQWFAFVGPAENAGWESPQAILKFLEANRFENCGAALGTELPLVICQAALQAVEKRKLPPQTAKGAGPQEGAAPLH
jgi:hypothetical protein